MPLVGQVPGVGPFNNATSMTPIQQVLAVTTSDVSAATSLPGGTPRAFYVNGAGNITGVDGGGNTFVIAIPATSVGLLIWIAVAWIKATGTTATGIYACY